MTTLAIITWLFQLIKTLVILSWFYTALVFQMTGLKLKVPSYVLVFTLYTSASGDKWICEVMIFILSKKKKVFYLPDYVEKEEHIAWLHLAASEIKANTKKFKPHFKAVLVSRYLRKQPAWYLISEHLVGCNGGGIPQFPITPVHFASERFQNRSKGRYLLAWDKMFWVWGLFFFRQRCKIMKCWMKLQ